MNKKKIYLSKVFREDKDKFKNEMMNYYYTSYPEWCCKKYDKIMFDDIKPYEFVKPIQKLKDYYESSKSTYYKELYDNISEYEKHTDVIVKNNKYIDQMIIEYCKCRKNISIITLWPKAKMTKKYKDKLLKLLNDNGNVYYIKEITLSYRGAQSLLYQLYSDSKRMKNMSSINYKIERVGWENNKNSKFTVIVYEHMGKNNIRGSSVSFKEQIRNIWLKDEKINNSMNENSKPRQYDYAHINDYYYQTVEYAQIYFNENSLKFLDSQLLDRYLNLQNRFKSSYIQLNTYKNILLMNFDPIDQIRSLIYSSAVLYTYGLRLFDDIDGMFLYLDKSDTENFDKKIDLFFKNDNTMIPFTDIAMEGTEGWEKYWEEYLVKLSKLCKIQNFNEIILNPDYHYYYNGIKFITLRLDIIKRLIRLRPNAYVDIIAINNLLGCKIYLPEILKNIPYYQNDIDIDKFLNIIKKGLWYRYHINIDIKDIKKYISNKKITTGTTYCLSNQKCIDEFIEDFDELMK